MRDRFSTKSESLKSTTAFLSMPSASIRSIAMPGLAGTPKDKKYSSLSSKLELKGLVKPETVSSARSTSSLQYYSVLSDILVKNELCIPLERRLNVIFTGESCICLSPPSKLKIAVLFVLSTKRQFRSVL